MSSRTKTHKANKTPITTEDITMPEPTVKDIYEYIDSIAPFAIQESYDNSGLNIGRWGASVSRVLVALDASPSVVNDALSLGADLIVTHHPVIFDPVRQIDLDSTVGRLAAGGISVISSHTCFDSAVMNRILCEKLGLTLSDDLTIEGGVPMGCICSTEPVSADELANSTAKRLGCPAVRYNKASETVSRIAVCSGSGGSLLPVVIARGCDCFITGDVKHNIFIDAAAAGVTVMDAGHYHTEAIFCEYMNSTLSGQFPGLSVEIAPSEKAPFETAFGN